MNSKSSFSAPTDRKPRSGVFSMRVELEEFGAKIDFHIAVYRDDLRCFVVLADIPSFPNTGGVDSALGAVLGHVLSTDLADWDNEKIVFGTTRWLTRRNDTWWRVIQRIQIVDGTAENPGQLPAEIGEPILRMLEGSVPFPNVLIEA